jgi:N-acetylmuramoyl-L-alanine amidase
MNKQETFDFLGITKFWDAGYTGKNVRIMSGERIIKDYEKTDRWHNVICPVGYQSEGGSWHGSSVMRILQDVCPDATYYSYPLSGSFTSNSYKSGCVDYIIENNIHLYTTSAVGGKVGTGKAKALQDCIDNGCTLFACAGNSGTNGIWDESKCDKYLTIGICDFVNGKLKWVSPSSVGEELDYVSLAGAYDRFTSWMTPQFTGMCGLAQDFFIINAGRALNREELIKFIDDNLIDIEEEGFDVKTGKGLFILPEPSSIDIGKYVKEYSERKEEKKMPRVYLDAGHGIDTAGKRSPDSSLLEYEFNRDVANRIEDILIRHDIEVMSCYSDTDTPLTQRCQMANMFNADYFVSIHANADKEYWTSANGWEIYVVSKGGKAEELAKKIHKYSQELGLKDRGIKTANFTVLTDTTMPAVLIEHGFYTNKEECEKLKDSNFRQKCAECDAKGILEQLGINYVPDINAATKNEVTDTNVGELVLKIGQKTYTINGQLKEIEVAPKIEKGRTLVPIAVLRDLGLEVEWNAEKKTVTVRR